MKTPLTKQEQRELDEIFRWMAGYVNYCNRVLCFWEKHGTHVPNPYLEKSEFLKIMERKYDPNQPRVPAGDSDGGQWTDGGGRGTRTPSRKPSRTKLPTRKPPFGFGRPMSDAELERFNRHAPRGTSPTDLEIHPDFGLPKWYIDGRVRDTVSPLDLVGGFAKPVAGAATSARNALRLRGYLKRARALPKGVKEVSRGADKLTRGQAKSLKSFIKKNPAFRDKMEVINYSDGRSIFTFKKPAGKIPGSYAVWEKQVNASGNIIRTNKTVVGPKGEFVHIRNYKPKKK